MPLPAVASSPSERAASPSRPSGPQAAASNPTRQTCSGTAPAPSREPRGAAGSQAPSSAPSEPARALAPSSYWPREVLTCIRPVSGSFSGHQRGQVPLHTPALSLPLPTMRQSSRIGTHPNCLTSLNLRPRGPPAPNYTVRDTSGIRKSREFEVATVQLGTATARGNSLRVGCQWVAGTD